MGASSAIGIISINNELIEHCAQGYHREVYASRKKDMELSPAGNTLWDSLIAQVLTNLFQLFPGTLPLQIAELFF